MKGISIFTYLIKVISCFLNEISGLSFKYIFLSYSTCQKNNYFYLKNYDTRQTRQYSTKLNMIHSSTQFCCTPLTCHCHSSYTSFVLETSILPPPPSTFFQNISTSLSPRSSERRHHGSQC